MTPRRGWPFSALLLAFTALFAVGCGPGGSVEDRVRERIRAMEAAGEAGERRAFMAFLAEDFEARDGSMTRDEFRRFLFLQMSSRRRIQAQLFPIAVDVTGANLAQARFNMLVTGGAGLIPDEGELFDVTTQWVLEGGEWMLWRADWRAVTP